MRFRNPALKFTFVYIIQSLSCNLITVPSVYIYARELTLQREPTFIRSFCYNCFHFAVGGHDSKEDAMACLDLMKMKVREDVKKLQSKARIQALQS